MIRIACILAMSLGLTAAALPARATEVVHPWVVPPPRLDKSAYFSNLADGASIETPFLLKFGLTGIGIAPIVKPVKGTGHAFLPNLIRVAQGAIRGDRARLRLSGGRAMAPDGRCGQTCKEMCFVARPVAFDLRIRGSQFKSVRVHH